MDAFGKYSLEEKKEAIKKIETLDFNKADVFEIKQHLDIVFKGYFIRISNYRSKLGFV